MRSGLFAASFTAVLALGFGLAQASPPTKHDDKLEKKLKDLRAAYADKLDPIIELCVTKNQKTRALELLETAERLGPTKKREALRAKVEAASDSPPQEKDTKEIAQKLKSAGDPHANKLLEVAGECFKLHQVSKALDLVHEAVGVSPDNKRARGLAGFEEIEVEKKKTWVTHWEAAQRKAGFVPFVNKDGKGEGWIPAKDKANWDAGKRFFDGRWVSEEEEAKERRSHDSHWFEVESEHFLIKTPTSRADAWELAQLLEEFQSAFFKTFIAFYGVDKGVELVFNVEPLKKKHLVMFYPDKKAYDLHVKTHHEGTQLLYDSAGFYSADYGCEPGSHFYLTERTQDVLETTYHEVTHQLFAETCSERGASVRSKGNNWVVEGIATYIETWAKDSRGEWVPGKNTGHFRMKDAQRVLAKTADWKLAPFLAIDHDAFHKGGARSENYSLSCAMAYFLMHGQDGRYHDDFVKFIAAYYDGKVTEKSLFEALGVDEATLEKQFKEFMSKLPSAN
jgi:hypothetical protein